MSIHYIFLLTVSIIFLIAGIITLSLYKAKHSQESKESLLGITVMLFIFGVVGTLFALIFGWLI
ncbi:MULTISPECIES: type II toxin-antitoxin system toxin TsaT [Staphylococcus]|uniref:Uncharacterized protein n=2 Tax=Staphylococcus TaxID=1279 RepID=A0A2K4FE37_9STAP|nr:MULTISPECIES: hypothetical protein [Staphylococcus]MBX8992739.1 hypothetical protein [Staphylococcus pettenkoferi]MCI2791114.1 hypothetical protein [Staphylococcus pettenkoferi]MCY1566713.1 hypothetical protein [Staphylococcus pettenkoferi]MCY1587662.1 hypothetical protein [Staphylococcus pettenkoferi]MCY1603280.1 hypothetical protein [Staphylococcus pettenkoferi]